MFWMRIAIVSIAAFTAGAAFMKTIMDKRVADLNAAHASYVAAQEAATRQALEAAQRRAAEAETRITQMEDQYVKALQAKDRTIAALNASGASMRKRLAALTAGSSPAPAGCEAPVRDLQDRIETLGRAVERLDDFAGRVVLYAEAVGDELRLCRAYAGEVSR